MSLVWVLACAAVDFSLSPGGYVTSWEVLSGTREKLLISDGRVGGRRGFLRATRGVDLRPFLPPAKVGRFRTRAVVRSTGGERELSVGSYGAMSVRLNGTEVVSFPRESYFGMTRKKASVDLEEGLNEIEVDVQSNRGEAGFFVRLRGGKGSGAEGDAVVVAGAGPADAARLLAMSLEMVASSAEITGNEPVILACRLSAGRPLVQGRVRVRFEVENVRGKELIEASAYADVGGRSEKLPSREIDCAALEGRMFACEWRTREESPVYRARAVVELDGKPARTREVLLYSRAGVESYLEELKGRTRALEEELERPLPLPRLKCEKVELQLSGRGGGRGGLPSSWEDLSAGMRALDAELAGRSPYPVTGFSERAYRSEIDGSAQPYLVYVPSGYDAAAVRAWPLVVYLHGYVPYYNKAYWLVEDPAMNSAVEEEGAILAVPFGRSNTDFLTVGEEDVLRVIEEMSRVYRIDARRVYLYGYSMGGSGVWTLLTHYPDRFAAGVVLAGRTDYYLWHELEPGDLPEWKNFLIGADNPIGLAENLRHVPVLVYHGTEDTLVKTGHAQNMVERMKELGFVAELRWIEGDHWSAVGKVLPSREPIEWLLRHERPEFPERVTFKTYTPKYGSAYWIEITSFRSWGEPASVNAVIEDGVAKVEADNVAEMQIIPPARARLEVQTADGGEYLAEWDEQGVYLAHIMGEPLPAKSRRMCGPVKEAFNVPFLLVAGDAEEDQANAQEFADFWERFAKGKPRLKNAAEVTESDLKSYSLILFGTPETNPLLARVADSLPAKLGGGFVEIAGKKTSLEGRGLVLCSPSPFCAERYVVVMSGLLWGRYLPINHKLDFVPDYIVFEDERDRADPMDPVNKAIDVGFFDVHWGRAPELKGPVAPRKEAAEPEPENPPARRGGWGLVPVILVLVLAGTLLAVVAKKVLDRAASRR